METHQHLYHEFDLVLEGEGAFSYGGRELEASLGDVFYIARGLRHRRESSREKPLKLCNIATTERALRAAFEVTKPCPLLCRWRGDGTPKTLRKAFEILFAAMPAEPGRPLKLETGFESAVCKLLAEALSFQGSLLGRRSPKLCELAARILAAPERRISLEEEAARASLSKFHFCRAFKDAFGVGMIEYRDLARIDLGIRKLREGEGGRVEELGRSLGYSSKAHFIGTFKRLAGAAPKAFKKGIQIE